MPNSEDCANAGAAASSESATMSLILIIRGTIRIDSLPYNVRPVLETLTALGRETARIVLHAPCVVCGDELPWRKRKASCCTGCWEALPRIAGSTCRSCAMPLSGAVLCIACVEDPLPVEWTAAFGHYRGPLERLLHAFKFERHDFLDAALAGLIEGVLPDRDFDCVVSVPMHRSKLRSRGYNQAELLARELAKALRVPYRAVLSKTAERRQQSTLARRDRHANVRGVFRASEAAHDARILLVDDVSTTGETLRACAEVLRKGGAKRVCAAVVAKA
jgi:ComF family protein